MHVCTSEWEAQKPNWSTMGEEIKTRTNYSSEERCYKGEKKNRVAAGERCAIKEGIIFSSTKDVTVNV